MYEFYQDDDFSFGTRDGTLPDRSSLAAAVQVFLHLRESAVEELGPAVRGSDEGDVQLKLSCTHEREGTRAYR